MKQLYFVVIFLADELSKSQLHQLAPDNTLLTFSKIL